MKIVYTEDALSDVDAILRYVDQNYPTVLTRFEGRLQRAAERIVAWPSSAPLVHRYPHVRAVNLAPYPYRLFYRVRADCIEILHVRHTARRLPWENGR